MTAFRNCLITCGAALGPDFVVRFLFWLLLRPLTRRDLAAGSPQIALVWALGLGAAIALLAGIGAGIGVQTNRSIGWSLLLAVLVALDSGRSMSPGAFPDVTTYATADFGASIIAGVVAFLAFHLTRAWSLGRTAAANAR